MVCQLQHLLPYDVCRLMFVALLLGLLLKGFVAKTILCTYVFSINPSLYNVHCTWRTGRGKGQLLGKDDSCIYLLPAITYFNIYRSGEVL